MAIAPEGPGHDLFAVSVALLALAWITIILRAIIRIKIKAFGRDDWLMCIGQVLFSVACVSTILAAFNGVGARADRLNDHYEKEGRKWFMFFQLFYVASTVPIKASICVALLRITPRRRYRWPLYVIVVLALLAAVTTNIAVLAQCRPVSATWDPEAGTCADPSVVLGVSYFISAVSILTDWACAILPAFILWDVQLPIRMKVSIAVVLALGVVASTATLVRLRYLLNYSNPEDYLYGIAGIGTWSIIESGIGIIAGSMATFRPLLKYLRLIGLSSAGSKPSANALSRRSHKMNVLGRPSSSGVNGLNTHCEGNKQNWEELSDGGSQKFILKESHIVVTHSQESTKSHSISGEVGGSSTTELRQHP